MKILILSCNTGQGHNSAGTAVYEELQRRGVDCEFKDALQFAGEKVSDSISKAYVFITTKAPPVFRFLYAAGGAISRPDKKSVIYYANKFYKDKIYEYIVQNGFDTVVTPHLFPAEVLTVLKKEKQLRVKTYAIATDYTCIPFWEETEMDFYFIPHKDLAKEFCEKGLPAEKLIATGIPVRKAFVSSEERQAAKRRLGFSEQEPLFLIMTGSMGYGNVEELTRHLLRRMGNRANIVIMGGNNQRMKEQLRERFSTYDGVHVLD